MGLGLGALDSRLFTAMVVMALVTTLMTGLLLERPGYGQELSRSPGPSGRDHERDVWLR
ncbi:hypothetical protein AB0B01_18910 [Streptomyces sp. NPDC044571]|uniref:hypothetical protein n=1 Tax=Streptomyces sp. NPDC044571 TaxID=3155371 RepID=UPI0033FCF724